MRILNGRKSKEPLTQENYSQAIIQNNSNNSNNNNNDNNNDNNNNNNKNTSDGRRYSKMNRTNADMVLMSYRSQKIVQGLQHSKVISKNFANNFPILARESVLVNTKRLSIFDPGRD